MKRYTNANLLLLKRREKGYAKELKRLYDEQLVINKKIMAVEENISNASFIDELYEGVALHQINLLGLSWVRVDDYMSGNEYNVGRYWDNAHNPGKGQWNMELSFHHFDGSFPKDEQKFFAFSFGTEKECIRACKRWAAFGELPKKKDE